MNRALKERIRNVPWLLRSFRHARHLARSLSVVVFNEPLMHLAESYLRRFYTIDTKRHWESPHPPPEWFDHRANLFRWSELRVPYWVERGVYSCEPMFGGCRVLDLCCGDGFYAYYFYSSIASHFDAVDRDPKAIQHAQKWHHHPNIRFVRLDAVADDFPMSEYDVICWDAAIEHFSVGQIETILKKCVSALQSSNGVLCGYTIITRQATKSHPDHQHEFTSARELKDILGHFFHYVGTIETEYPDRHNIYFRAAFDRKRLRRFD